MTKSLTVNKTFLLLLIILFSVQDFVFAKRSFFEPSDISIFRKAYPDVEFESEYDNELSDWKITINENDDQTVLYWADGRLLPKDKLSNEEYYFKILYSYPTKIPDPKNFT